MTRSTLWWDGCVRDWRIGVIRKRYRHGEGIGVRFGPLVWTRVTKRRGGRE